MYAKIIIIIKFIFRVINNIKQINNGTLVFLPLSTNKIHDIGTFNKCIDISIILDVSHETTFTLLSKTRVANSFLKQEVVKSEPTFYSS